MFLELRIADDCRALVFKECDTSEPDKYKLARYPRYLTYETEGRVLLGE